MKDFSIKRTELCNTTISTPDLISRIMDDGEGVSKYIEKNGCYEHNELIWLGFCNSSPIALSSTEWRTDDWGELYVRYGDANMIAAMMSAVLRADGQPYLIQAEQTGSVPKNEICHIQLCVYEIIPNE